MHVEHSAHQTPGVSQTLLVKCFHRQQLAAPSLPLQTQDQCPALAIFVFELLEKLALCFGIVFAVAGCGTANNIQQNLQDVCWNMPTELKAKAWFKTGPNNV
jgi:hypothetical protein